jgi:hypothetical protein
MLLSEAASIALSSLRRPEFLHGSQFNGNPDIEEYGRNLAKTQ